jgi:hypothetical protein
MAPQSKGRVKKVEFICLISWANFSIVMECTPKNGRCHSVYSVKSVHGTTEEEIYKIFSLQQISQRRHNVLVPVAVFGAHFQLFIKVFN